MRIVTFCCMALMIILTWLRLEEVASSVLSLVYFVWLWATGADFGALYRPGLFEFWVAGSVWVAVLLLLFRASVRILRGRNADSLPFSAHRPAVTVIFAVIFVSLACPLLAPFDPVSQGDLVTTRHLPPLSSGSVSDRASTVTEAVGARELYDVSGDVLLSKAGLSFSGKSDGTALNRSPVLFILGTDNLGRDIFSRVLYGARISLLIGVLAALGAVLLGSLIGFSAGMSGGPVDPVLMRLTDIALSVPAIFLVILLVAFLGQSLFTVVLSLVLTGWMSVARMIRDEVRSLREREFVLSARLLRIPPVKIVTRHLLPNVMPLLVTAVVLQFSNAVLAEAALGFLGIGVQPPTPTWGNMMGDATAHLAHAWWPGFFPGLFLSIVIVVTHMVVSPQPRVTERT